MKIVIIEDEPQAVDRMIHYCGNVHLTATVVAGLDTIKASVAWIKANDPVDLYLNGYPIADGLSFEYSIKSKFDRSSFSRLSTKVRAERPSKVNKYRLFAGNLFLPRISGRLLEITIT